MDRQGKATLKALISKAGLNYREVAKRLNTTHALVSYWHQGKAHPSFRTACRLARELNVSLEELAESLGYIEEAIESEETIE